MVTAPTTSAHGVAMLAALLLAVPPMAAQQAPTLPTTPLAFGFFTARFAPDGTFTMTGDGWPTFTGTWTLKAEEIELETPSVKACVKPGRYRVELRDAAHVRLDLVADECQPRRMILDRSQLAVVPRPRCGRRGSRAEPSRPLGRQDRRQCPLAHAHPRPRPFESRRVG
jgi:hypothetical protein